MELGGFVFLRSEESKEECAVEATSPDTDEELYSDSCSNAENIQPEGAATSSETQLFVFSSRL